MEEITADYWKGIVRGVFYMFLSTILYTTQTSIVKWGSIIGYTAAVIVVFRGIIQFILCLIEATVSFDKIKNPFWFHCDICRIFTDIKSIGILPKRTIIPIFHETISTQSKSNLDLHSDLYSSFQSNTSYSSLTDSKNIMDSNLNMNMNLNINNNSSSELKIDSNCNNNNNNNYNPINTQQIQIVHTTSQNLTMKSKLLHQSQSNINIKRSKKHNLKRMKSYKCLIWSAIILRGIFGGIGTLILFMASIILPIGDIQSLMSLTAIFTPFLAFIFFKDNVNILHAISLFGALAGVVLIIQPSFIFNNDIHSENKNNKKNILLGYIYAIIGSFIQSLIYICIQFTRKVPVYLLTMSQSIWGIITGFVVLIFASNNNGIDNVLWIDNWFNVGYILILGFVGYIFLWLLQMSGKYLSSGVVALLLNLSIVWGYIVQIIVFHETPTWITIIGAVCMFLSAAIVSVDKVHDAKKKSMSVIQRNVSTVAV